jgi:hypothetical protein
MIFRARQARGHSLRALGESPICIRAIRNGPENAAPRVSNNVAVYVISTPKAEPRGLLGGDRDRRFTEALMDAIFAFSASRFARFPRKWMRSLRRTRPLLFAASVFGVVRLCAPARAASSTERASAKSLPDVPMTALWVGGGF